MTINAPEHVLTLEPGERRNWGSPGAEIICSESTAPLMISTDQGSSFARFERGIAVVLPHTADQIIFKNPSTEAITFSFVQTNEPGVWVDNRELGEVDISGGVTIMDTAQVNGTVEVFRAKTIGDAEIATVTNEATIIIPENPDRVSVLIKVVSGEIWIASRVLIFARELNKISEGETVSLEVTGDIYMRTFLGTAEIEYMEFTL